VEFARQFNIAQTFGQNRSSVEEEGNTEVWPVEMKAWYPFAQFANRTSNLDQTCEHH